MTQPTDPTAASSGERSQVAGERPPKRLLDRAPSERLAAAGSGGSGAGSVPRVGSTAGAIGFGLVAAAGGIVVHLVAASLLLWTSALVVVAVTIGIVVGLAVAVGGGTTIAPGTRRALAIAFAVGAVVAAVVINWALSGMYLGPLDYLAQVYGLLVPAQLVLAAAGAVAGAR